MKKKIGDGFFILIRSNFISPNSVKLENEKQ